jgi:hypothetical protein
MGYILYLLHIECMSGATTHSSREKGYSGTV